jgi:hypothetical protein
MFKAMNQLFIKFDKIKPLISSGCGGLGFVLAFFIPGITSDFNFQ